MALTEFDALSVLPAEWRAKLAERELVAVTAGMSGAHVFRVRDPVAGDQYLKIDFGPDAAQLRREAERTQWLAAVGVRVPEVTMQFAGMDAFAFMMAALGGEPAESISPDDWRPVVSAIAQAFAALHVLPTDSCPFDETLKVRLARAR